MTRNVTLRLDEEVLRRARHLAVEEDQSLSQWVTNLVSSTVSGKTDFATARRRAMKHLDAGLHLGGKPIQRENIYDR